MKPLNPGIDYHPAMLRRFNTDIKDHQMEILQDDGLHRHLVFSKVEHSWHYRFNIITTPGQLTITGDMGTYVFARIEDMFKFFHGYVNAGYWGEKLQAIDKHCGYREHSEDRFKRFVLEDFWERRTEYDVTEAAKIWADIREDMFGYFTDITSTHECIGLLTRFDSYGFTYMDAWEHDFEEYSAQYLWCCHAILWAIEQYRAERAGLERLLRDVEAAS